VAVTVYVSSAGSTGTVSVLLLPTSNTQTPLVTVAVYEPKVVEPLLRVTDTPVPFVLPRTVGDLLFTVSEEPLSMLIE
jgi:hypothetical protein